ncbi:MAG: hypothetical protein HY721_35690, partial [Planctomycetes bacterium]|nr:hypothetical protein [Planctomycetota bacterium]
MVESLGEPAIAPTRSSPTRSSRSDAGTTSGAIRLDPSIEPGWYPLWVHDPAEEPDSEAAWGHSVYFDVVRGPRDDLRAAVDFADEAPVLGEAVRARVRLQKAGGEPARGIDVDGWAVEGRPRAETLPVFPRLSAHHRHFAVRPDRTEDIRGLFLPLVDLGQVGRLRPAPGEGPLGLALYHEGGFEEPDHGTLEVDEEHARVQVAETVLRAPHVRTGDDGRAEVELTAPPRPCALRPAPHGPRRLRGRPLRPGAPHGAGARPRVSGARGCPSAVACSRGTRMLLSGHLFVFERTHRAPGRAGAHT